MSHDHSRFEAAIQRTFAEANNALLKLTAYNALCREDITYIRMSFFVVAQQALHNDMIANAIRIMDEHRDATAFWYLHRCHKSAVEFAITNAGTDMSTLQATSAKLKHIREKTHFHIDRTAVARPSEVWQSAGVTGDEFSRTLRVVASVASHLNTNVLSGQPLDVTQYDGSDIHLLVTSYEELHGRTHGV